MSRIYILPALLCALIATFECHGRDLDTTNPAGGSTSGTPDPSHGIDSVATRGAITRDCPMMWPLVDGYHNPNRIVYDRKRFESYLSFYADGQKICGKGPSCEMKIRGAPTRFRSRIDYGHIGTRFHIDQLRKFLRSRIDGTKGVFTDSQRPGINPYVRDVSFCVGLIADAKAREAIPELNQLLCDRRSEIRIEAIWAIRALGPDATEAVVSLAEVLETDLASEASKALASIGEAAIPVLRKKVNAGGTDARIFSIEALGSIGPGASSAVDELVKAMYEKKDATDRSGYISSYAAAALGRIQDRRALLHLRKMNVAKNHDVRDASRRAIREIERVSLLTPQ